jgi:FkbM family methyltransferase
MSAAFDMARTVGLGPTAVRVRNYVHAKLADRQRARQFRRMDLDGKVVRSILGSKMQLDANAPGIDRDLLLDGIREPIATGHLLGILRPDDVVLEVGANIGYYALIEARICKKIYAAEPHPGNFERLNGNVALNNFANIETFNVAFGAENKKLYLECSALSNWHSCRGTDAHSPNTVAVDGWRIDSFLEGREKPTLIKMDVEGYELEVLRGARQTLHSIRHLFLELHGAILSPGEIRELLDLVKAAGLRPSLIAQYDRPGLSQVCDIGQLEMIYSGDRGTYELFFTRD